MNHKRAFRIKYLSPTNTKGERVKIIDIRHKNSWIISYDYSKNNIKEIAIEFLKNEGIKIDGYFYDEHSHEYYLMTDSFESVKYDYINPKNGILDRDLKNG